MDDPVKRYIIAGPTRSGTTALHLLLAGHPQVSVFVGELHFPRLASGFRQFSVNGYLTDREQRLGHVALFDALTGIYRTSTTRVLGTKITINSPRMAHYFLQTVRKHLPGTKIITSVRNDTVAHYGSRAYLKKTGIAHSWNRKVISSNDIPISLDRWLLANSVLTTLETYKVLSSASEFTEYHQINYEDFAADNESTYRHLISFLELDYVQPEWLTAKRLHPDPASYINNYAKLAKYAEQIKTAYLSNRLSNNYLRAIKLYAKINFIIRSIILPKKSIKTSHCTPK